MKKLLEFLSDGVQLSMTRLILLLWCVLVMVLWTILSLKSHVIQDIPNGVTIITTALISCKAAQNFTERV